MIYKYFEDPYIYGPLTEEETKNILVNHRLSLIEGNYYIGVSCELEQLSDRQIIRPNLQNDAEDT